MFGIWDKIINFIYELFYYLGVFFMKILHYLYLMMEVFVGTRKVTYYSSDNYLINIFFSNTTVTTVYGGMALIGFVILVVMTIFAIYKKMHDLGDQMTSMGEILRKALTSFIFILSMNFIMIATLNITNTLMRSVQYLFDNAYAMNQVTSITFTTKQYGAMARIFNTIGNYSLSKSYTSRYNLNACFNEIRPDMEYLERTNVFRFSYDNVIDGERVESWQSVLSQIARTADLSEDLPLDEYNVSVSAALLDAMEYCRQNNNDMVVLQSYSEGSSRYVETEADIDVLFWLGATTEAAHNGSYNGDYADFTDPVRNPYRIGQRSIYNVSQVEEDFNLSFSRFSHILIILGGILMCYEFLGIAINSISRIYNMLILYLMAPPLIATAPFDDGEKFKQWSRAFIIQAFGVFGTIIAIRLMMLLIPIIYDSNLVILNTGFFGMFAKTLMVFTLAFTARKASGLISGIMAGDGGGSSVKAMESFDAMRQGTVGRRVGQLGKAGAAGIHKAYRKIFPKKDGNGKQIVSKTTIKMDGGADPFTNMMMRNRKKALEKLQALGSSSGSDSTPGVSKSHSAGGGSGTGSGGGYEKAAGMEKSSIAGSAGNAGSSGGSQSVSAKAPESMAKSSNNGEASEGERKRSASFSAGADSFRQMDKNAAMKKFHMDESHYAAAKEKLDKK